MITKYTLTIFVRRKKYFFCIFYIHSFHIAIIVRYLDKKVCKNKLTWVKNRIKRFFDKEDQP